MILNRTERPPRRRAASLEIGTGEEREINIPRKMPQARGIPVRSAKRVSHVPTAAHNSPRAHFTSPDPDPASHKGMFTPRGWYV
jgi:hypothetical protein